MLTNETDERSEMNYYLKLLVSNKIRFHVLRIYKFKKRTLFKDVFQLYLICLDIVLHGVP